MGRGGGLKRGEGLINFLPRKNGGGLGLILLQDSVNSVEFVAAAFLLL